MENSDFEDKIKLLENEFISSVKNLIPENGSQKIIKSNRYSSK